MDYPEINTKPVLAGVIQKLQCESCVLAASVGPDEMMCDLSFHTEAESCEVLSQGAALFCTTHVREQLHCRNISS